MADEQNRAALALQPPHQRDQLRHLRRRQHGSRLVEDQDVDAAIEEPQDFQNLPDMNRGVRNPRAPIDRDAGDLRQPVSLRSRRAPVDQAAAAERLVGEDQIFEQRQRRREHEFLMHHADPAREGVRGPRQSNRRVVQNDAALVGTVDALQYPHQRRFSRAVPADDGMDRARRDCEIDAVDGDHRAELSAELAGADANSDAGRPPSFEIVRIALIDDVPDLYFA